jgi:hypothetical protein
MGPCCTGCVNLLAAGCVRVGGGGGCDMAAMSFSVSKLQVMEHILGGTDLRAEGGGGATKTQAKMTQKKNKVSKSYVAGSIMWRGPVARIVIVARNVNHRGGTCLSSSVCGRGNGWWRSLIGSRRVVCSMGRCQYGDFLVKAGKQCLGDMPQMTVEVLHS